MCSTDSVVRWLAIEDKDIDRDRRGWPKGRTRKYGELEKERLESLHGEMEYGESFPVSTRDLKAEYKNRFGTDISEWFIYRVLREIEVAGEARIRAEPYKSFARFIDMQLKDLGEVIMRVSFRGSRYAADVDGSITARKSLNLLSCRYIYPFEFGIISQISTCSPSEVKRVMMSVFQRYVRPDIVIMSYHSAFGANLSHHGCIGHLAFFLLNVGIRPMYSFFEGLLGRSGLARSDRIFSGEFLKGIIFERWRKGRMEIKNFYLEYSGRPGTLSDEIKTKNPFFVRAFTEDELSNMHVDGFLERTIFFCVLLKKR